MCVVRYGVPWVYIPKIDTVDLCGISIYSFGGNSILIFRGAAPVYIPISRIAVDFFLSLSHFDWGNIKYQCDF